MEIHCGLTALLVYQVYGAQLVFRVHFVFLLLLPEDTCDQINIYFFLRIELKTNC